MNYLKKKQMYLGKLLSLNFYSNLYENRSFQLDISQYL